MLFLCMAIFFQQVLTKFGMWNPYTQTIVVGLLVSARPTVSFPVTGDETLTAIQAIPRRTTIGCATRAALILAEAMQR